MNALIIMTRVPIAGKTKTRLMKILSGEQCAQIHRCFLLDLFKMLGELKETMDIDIYVTYTPENSFHLLEDIVPHLMNSFPQKGDNLGSRMNNAFERLLDKGYSKVLLIGSDIPILQPDDIKKAYKVLDDTDICLGPTKDGGYYLIGMKQKCSDIFGDNLKWGNKSVYETTVSIANYLNLSVGLTTKLNDIDEEEDIEDLMVKIKKGELKLKILPDNTIKFIEKLYANDLTISVR